MVLTIAISLQPLENPQKKIWHWKIWNISHLLANRYSHWKTPEKKQRKNWHLCLALALRGALAAQAPRGAGGGTALGGLGVLAKKADFGPEKV